MSKSLFFNALYTGEGETGYDREYNADDLSDFLSIVCDIGVIKGDGLKVTASGMGVNVAAGKAVIKGKAFINETTETFTVSANGTSANRYDYVVLKFDNNISARKISLELRTGTSSVPTVANLTRNDKVYELMLAYITVAPNATSVGSVTDLRGKATLCPWFTAAKGYEEYYDAIIEKHESTVTMATAGVNVVTTLPASLYNAKYSLIEVYTNGLKEPTSAYTARTEAGYIVVTFAAQKVAGAKITVVLSNFIDGEGMATALTQYTQLLQDVADLKGAGEYNYICNGVNDNVLLSNLVRNIYSVNDYASFKVNVIGNFGITAAYGGSGTKANPYVWINFNNPVDTNRIVTVDFTRASAISPIIEGGTDNLIFRTNKIIIVGATVIASNTSANTLIVVNGATSGAIKYKDCRFYITAYYDSVIAYRGTFENCRGSVANISTASYCFLPNTDSVVKIVGGEYYAYTGDSTKASAVVGQSGANAVSILYGVSAPTLARSGFLQTHAVLQYGGVINCTDMITELTVNVMSGASNVRGTIAKSKNNVW
jgi:hypothetical protein